MDIESDELQEPPLRVADFLKSLDSVRPTVTAEDIRKHDAWTMESGELPALLLRPPALIRSPRARGGVMSVSRIMTCCTIARIHLWFLVWNRLIFAP